MPLMLAHGYMWFRLAHTWTGMMLRLVMIFHVTPSGIASLSVLHLRSFDAIRAKVLDSDSFNLIICAILR
jgi:uncharacterized membrane protein